MKAVKIIGLVLVSLLLLGGIYWLITKSQNDSANESVFKAIPEDAEGILVINVEAFMTLFLTNLGDVIELSEQLSEENDAEEFQKQAQLSGINLSRKIAIYTKGESFNVLVPVKSKEDFSAYLEKQITESNLTAISDSEYYSSELGTYITFNENLCFISQVRRSNLESAQAAWASISQPSEEKELSPVFMKLQDSDEHMAFYMKEDEMAKRSPVFKNSPDQFATLTFEDGLIRIISKNSSSKDGVKNPLLKGGKGAEESEYLSIHTHIDPDAGLDYWLTEEALAEWKKGLVDADAKASSKEFVQKWNGTLNFSLTGSEKALEETITYDYDDNFNMIEKKELVEKNNLSYSGYIGFREPLSSEDFLTDQVEGVNTFFSKGEDNSLWFSSKNEFSKEAPDAEHAMELIAYPAALIDLGVRVELPFVQMADRFKHLIEKIHLTADPDGNEINSELMIYTGDKEKNSLIFLAGEMKKFRF